MKGSTIVYMYKYKTKIRHHNSKHCDMVTFVVIWRSSLMLMMALWRLLLREDNWLCCDICDVCRAATPPTNLKNAGSVAQNIHIIIWWVYFQSYITIHSGIWFQLKLKRMAVESFNSDKLLLTTQGPMAMQRLKNATVAPIGTVEDTTVSSLESLLCCLLQYLGITTSFVFHVT